MKCKAILIFMTFLCVFMGVHAEKKETHENLNNCKWVFYFASPQIDPLMMQEASNKYLGKRNNCLYHLFEDKYITKETVVPGDPRLRTIIHKPVLYKTVKTLRSYLSRQYKKRKIDKTKAEIQLTHILNVAIAAIDSDTKTFEQKLKDNKKDKDSLLLLFKNVTLKNMY